MISKILLFPAVITLFIPILSTRMNIFIRAANVCVECPPDTCPTPCTGNTICIESRKQSCYKCPKYKCLSPDYLPTNSGVPESTYADEEITASYTTSNSNCIECPTQTCNRYCSQKTKCVQTRRQSCYRCAKFSCVARDFYSSSIDDGDYIETQAEEIYPETTEYFEETATGNVYPESESTNSSPYFEETEDIYPETLELDPSPFQEEVHETPDSSTPTSNDLLPTYPPHEGDNDCILCTQQTCSEPCPYAAMVCVDVRKQTCKQCAKWRCVALALGDGSQTNHVPANFTGELSTYGETMTESPAATMM
jgi:hypothetical protein